MEFIRIDVKIVNADLMRQIDAAAIKSGIPSLVLMERAGEGLALAVKSIVNPNDGKIVIICGRGNNGGDGLVAARFLINEGFDVVVELCAHPEDLSPDARVNWEQLAPITTNIHELTDAGAMSSCSIRWAGASCFVDALLGTGLSKEVTGFYAEIINELNSQKAPIVSADIPSGLDANKGLPLGNAVKAKQTVTFGFPKLGFYIGDGALYTGEIEIVDIGIPKNVSEQFKSPYALIDKTLVEKSLPKRTPKDHKGTYGHVLVIAGHKGRLGAGYLSSISALKTGSGLVTYALPSASFEKFDTKYPEIMPEMIADQGRGYFSKESARDLLNACLKKDAVAIGPAIGTEPITIEFMKKFLPNVPASLVIDADALNSLQGTKGLLAQRKFPTVLTPHPGEMGRLLGISVSDVESDRIKAAKTLCDRERSVVVLKGHNTLVTDGKLMLINPTGNAGMATAGSGDVLTGIIASLLGQGLPGILAAAIGVYIHGFAGDLALKTTGERGMVASDIIKALSGAFKSIENN